MLVEIGASLILGCCFGCGIASNPREAEEPVPSALVHQRAGSSCELALCAPSGPPSNERSLSGLRLRLSLERVLCKS